MDTPENKESVEAVPSPAAQDSLRKWYTVQTRSNMERKAVETLKRMIDREDMGEYISKDDVIAPEETVSMLVQVKRKGKLEQQQKQVSRMLYPGYIFVRVKLFDEEGNFLEKPWYFIKGINGIVNFIGGDTPIALSQEEITNILSQKQQAEGAVRPRIVFSVGEMVKITDGPFLGLIGKVEEINEETCKMKVTVDIFGRFTPVELEYNQVVKSEEIE